MGIDVSIEDEQGKQSSVVLDPNGYLAMVLQLPAVENTVCVRFIDPYGDTIFNQLQIPRFITELTEMRDLITKDALCALADRSFETAKRAGTAPLVLRKLKEQAGAVAVESVQEHIRRILELAGEAHGDVHTYLRFSGD